MTSFRVVLLILFTIPSFLGLQPGRSTASNIFRKTQKLLSSEVNVDQDITDTVTVRVVSQNPFGTPISVDNPFGHRASNIPDTVKEILDLASSSKLGLPEPQIGYRLDYLAKFLESKYVPIHTKEFYSLTHAGAWVLVYSNSLTPKANENLSYSVEQEICPDELHSHGKICNRLLWRLKQEVEDALGVLEVNCTYRLAPNGAMQVSLVEHVLSPDVFPSNSGLTVEESCELLLELIQSSIPYEFFDPSEITMGTSYLDPSIRISRVLGEKYPNVMNIFIKKNESN